MPRSPSCRSASELPKRPRPYGPMAQPSARKPSTGVTFSCRHTGTTSTEAARKMKMSLPSASRLTVASAAATSVVAVSATYVAVSAAAPTSAVAVCASRRHVLLDRAGASGGWRRRSSGSFVSIAALAPALPVRCQCVVAAIQCVTAALALATLITAACAKGCVRLLGIRGPP